jgi:hypothetical protein
MAALLIALIVFVALPVLSLRYGVDSRPHGDWREAYRPERDPRS